MALSNNRIVITGCSGGGKSTLVEALARRGHKIMPEPGRIIVREELAGDGAALPWIDVEKFARRAVKMGQQFYSEAANHPGPVFFDRSILEATAGLERAGLAHLAEFADLLANLRYAPTAFIAPPWPELFAKDEERKMGIEHALAEYEHLLTYYPAQGYTLIELPKISVADRVKFVESKLAEMGFAAANPD